MSKIVVKEAPAPNQGFRSAMVDSLPGFLRQREALLLCVLLFALVLWAFFPATGNGFVGFDDPEYVTANRRVQQGLTWENLEWAFCSSQAANWHPMTWLSHMLDCQLFGLAPWGHHLTSVLLHAANTMLAFVVLKRMTGATWRSLIVAMFFGLHPLRVESVAWVAERKDVLSAFFFMLTLWAYVRYAEESKVASENSKAGECVSSVEGQTSRAETCAARTQNPESTIQDRTHRISNHAGRYYALTLVLFALGLMSKPMLVTLPFVLLLLDYWPLRRLQLSGSAPRSPLRQLILEKLPFFFLAAVACVVTYQVQRSGGAVGTVESFPIKLRLANAFIGYARYIRKMVWPDDLAAFYPYPGAWPLWEVLATATLLAGMSFIAVRTRHERPYLITG